MGTRLTSSKERRLQSFRRTLVLSLTTRNGEFWERVDWIRGLQRITPERRMPPPLNPGRVHRPSWIMPVRGEAAQAYARGMHEWMVLLNVLHNEVIPHDLQIETPYSYSLDFWMGFLSACVVYDPPPDDLLGFAEHGVAAYGDFVNPFDPEGAEDGFEMLAPPIRYLPEPEQVIADERERQEWVLRRLQAAITSMDPSQLGDLDLTEMAAHFEFVFVSEREKERKLNGRRPDIPTQSYITVDPYTTEEDVRNAFRLMAAVLPERPRAARPRRDQLVALQCAIWHDDYHWSQEQIAQAMGWTVQHPGYAKPRSETVRRYIVDGRSLRDHKNAAA